MNIERVNIERIEDYIVECGRPSSDDTCIYLVKNKWYAPSAPMLLTARLRYCMSTHSPLASRDASADRPSEESSLSRRLR